MICLILHVNKNHLIRGKGIVKKVLGKYGAHLAKLNLATSGVVIVIGAAFMIGQGLYSIYS